MFDAVDAGIGIDLTSPDFTMAISNVEKGSPAGAHTGRKTWSSTTPGGEALGMTVRSLEGKQFLLVEIGGFPEEVTPDFQGAHILYVEE